MSYTQFVATAFCTVVDGFNLESYLDALSKRCVKEDNFIAEEYGVNEDQVDIHFDTYVRMVGSNVLIECDTEENNNNSEIWDWLVGQFVPVMVSDLMEIKSATIDSRSGVDVDIVYLKKNGDLIIRVTCLRCSPAYR
jgi:hypothetical protein